MLSITYRNRKTNRIEQVRRRSGLGQGTSAEYEITDEYCVAPPGNPGKGNDLEGGRRDGGETNWKGTIWRRIAQDIQMRKQHAEVYIYIQIPRYTMAAL